MQGQLSCFHAFRAGSPALLTTGSSLVCCPGRVQGLLSCVLQQVRGMASSLILVTPGPVLLSAAGSKGQRGEGRLSLTCATT